jgi:nucleotide-binding universal stress UspA family protein
MTGTIVVAGVDTSPEGGWAAVTAWRLADAVAGRTALIHAVSDAWIPPGRPPIGTDEDVRAQLAHHASDAVRESLVDHVPDACLERLDVRFGSPASVLAEAAAELGAALIVVGGKRHSALGRWLAGSTVHQLLRISVTPILVATPTMATVRRMLVAVDVDDTAAATIAAGEHLAAQLGADLRFIHALEPIPYAADLEPYVDVDEVHRASRTILEQRVWPLISDPTADRVVREGSPTAVIEVEARAWDADLVVVGHHSRSQLDRLVLGSVSYDLLHDLPSSIMVVHPQAVAPPAPVEIGGT